MDPLLLPAAIGTAIIMVVFEVIRRWVNKRKEVRHAAHLPDGYTSGPSQVVQSTPDGGPRP